MIFASGWCGSCGALFTYNPERVPSWDIEARTEAIRIVDQRHGYTVEHAADPDAHHAEYDEVEQELFDSSRRVPLCEPCVVNINHAREAMGLPPWEIFHDSYGYAEAL